MAHVPVLLNEVVKYLNAKNGGDYVDATAGAGGHIRGILRSNPTNRVLGIDLDQTSQDKLKDELVQEGLAQRTILVQGSYKDIDKILSEVGKDKVNGIILDLGFSSVQVDDPSRGFSFANDGPLDMRYDKNSGKTAEYIINSYHPKELERIIAEYGEEKFSRRIAGKIIEARKVSPIKTTDQLAKVIKSAIPLPVRFKVNDSIRRVFQAIRIEVNSELDNLKTALPKMLAALDKKGRLVVISFHSLEDRIVKEFFLAESKDCVCPPEFPTCICGKASTIRILTRKPVVASEEEITINTRSKPAKLRACEKN